MRGKRRIGPAKGPARSERLEGYDVIHQIRMMRSIMKGKFWEIPLGFRHFEHGVLASR